MTSIRLVALDIDGTIVDSSKRLRPRTRRAIGALAGRGIEIALATGRIDPAARSVAVELGVRASIVSQNGSVVRTPGGDESHPIAPAEVDRVLDLVDDLPAVPLVFTEEEIVIRTAEVEWTRLFDRWTGGRHYRTVDDLRACGAPISQVHLVTRIEHGPATRDSLLERLGRTYDVFAYRNAVHESFHIEVRMPGVDKGTGLSRVRDRLGLVHDEVLAAGDWLNDLPLLDAAGVKVAMKGAPEALLERASHVTPGSSDEDGLAAFLETYFDLPA